MSSQKPKPQPPMYYSTDQFGVLFPYLKRTPEWLILGGPADGNEAQCARNAWPTLKVIAVEPNAEAVKWQREVGRWPEGAILLEAALSFECGEGIINSPTGYLRSSSMDPIRFESEGKRILTVPTVTIDSLDEQYGPFNRAVLWMDIECWEWEAMQGARKVFARGAIDAVNVEMQLRHQLKNDAMHAFLTEHGFKVVREWNDSVPCRDRIYIRDL